MADCLGAISIAQQPEKKVRGSHYLGTTEYIHLMFHFTINIFLTRHTMINSFAEPMYWQGFCVLFHENITDKI